jgi:hypothetical protein
MAEAASAQEAFVSGLMDREAEPLSCLDGGRRLASVTVMASKRRSAAKPVHFDFLDLFGKAEGR